MSVENYHAEARRCGLRCDAAAASSGAPHGSVARAPLPQVTLTPAERVSFEAHPLHDPQDFADLGTLAGARSTRPHAPK